MPAELTIGVLRERGAGERRVALVPEVIAKVPGTVVVESGAGDAAWFPDDDVPGGRRRDRRRRRRQRAGGRGASASPRPTPSSPRNCPTGRAHAGLLRPLRTAGRGGRLGVAESDHGQPRPAAPHAEPGPDHGRADLARPASPATSAVVRSRPTPYPAGFPMLITAAGTVRPAERAGARRRRGRPAGDRHGPPPRRRGGRATTSGPAARDEVDLARRQVRRPGRGPTARGGRRRGGYARELTRRGAAGPAGRPWTGAIGPRRRGHHHRAGAGPQAARAGHPPRRSPRCDPARWWSTWPPAGYGGNVVGSRSRTHRGHRRGVTVIGAGNLPSRHGDRGLDGLRPQHRRPCWSLLVVDGALRIDLTDEMQPGVAASSSPIGGAVANPAVAALLQEERDEH